MFALQQWVIGDYYLEWYQYDMVADKIYKLALKQNGHHFHSSLVTILMCADSLDLHPYCHLKKVVGM